MCSLEWPLCISPSHALQLQSAAAIRALNPIKSRHAQVSVYFGGGGGGGGGGGEGHYFYVKIRNVPELVLSLVSQKFYKN